MPIKFHSSPVPADEYSINFRDIDGYGAELQQTPAWLSTITFVEIVVVTGSTPCGHALICLNRSHYIHIAGFHKRPHYMTSRDYHTYLSSHHKTEVYRSLVTVMDKNALADYLGRRIEKPWLWLLLPNNCYAFVESVLDAGRTLGHYHKTFNCPEKSDDDIWDKINENMDRAGKVYNPTGRPAWR